MWNFKMSYADLLGPEIEIRTSQKHIPDHSFNNPSCNPSSGSPALYNSIQYSAIADTHDSFTGPNTPLNIRPMPAQWDSITGHSPPSDSRQLPAQVDSISCANDRKHTRDIDFLCCMHDFVRVSSARAKFTSIIDSLEVHPSKRARI